MSDSDRDLLDRYRRGDAAAMDQLVDRHAAAVYAFVARFVGDRELAEDLTQEVWLRLLRRPEAFGGHARLTTWLFAVARNVCIDAARRAQRRQGETPPDLHDVPDPGPGVLARVAGRELGELVAQAVDALPPEQREVFLLREQTPLTFQQIAEALELPRDTVKSRMRYALERVRRSVLGALARTGGGA